MQASASTCVPLSDGASRFISSPSWATSRSEELVGLHRLLQRPVIVVAIEDAGLRLHVRPFERRREQLHLVTELGDFLEYPGGGPRIVRQDRAVEFLRAEPRLAPAEEDNRRCPPRHQ